jgi:hypothetical protein
MDIHTPTTSAVAIENPITVITKNPKIKGIKKEKRAIITASFLSSYNSLQELSRPAINIRDISPISPRIVKYSIAGSSIISFIGEIPKIKPPKISKTTDEVFTFLEI